MEFAGMAKPNIANANYDFDKESEVLFVDNGATTTVSNTLFNISNVVETVQLSLLKLYSYLKHNSKICQDIL